MAINRISGNILQDNLVRGANLAIQTDLFYVDVFNQRIGINTASTTHTLTVNGDTNITGNASANNVSVSNDIDANNVIANNDLFANNASITYNIDTHTLLVTDSIEVGNGVAGLQIGNIEIEGVNYGAIWAAGADRDLANLALGATRDFGGNIVTLLGGDQIYALDQSGNVSFAIDTDLANVTVYGNLIIAAGNGNIDADTNYINNLSDPIEPQDAATKFYVDQEVSNVQFTITDGANSQVVYNGDSITLLGVANETTVEVSASDTITIGLPNDVIIVGNLTVGLETYIGGNLLPTTANVFSIGNATNRFSDLWLTGNTMVIGDVNFKQISYDIDGDPVLSLFDETGTGYATINVNTVQTITAEVEGNTISGNVNANNYVTATNVIASANVDAGNVNSTSLVTTTEFLATGNATAANVNANLWVTATDIIAYGNIYGNTGTITNMLYAGTLETAGNALIGGNLIVQGNITYINIDDLRVEDPVIILGTGANGAPLIVNDGRDRGTQLDYFVTAANLQQSAFMGYDNSAGNMILATNVVVTNDIVTVYEWGTLQAGNIWAQSINISGDITANNITALQQIAANTAVITNGVTAGSIVSSGNIQGLNLISNNDVVTQTVTASANVLANNINSNNHVSTATLGASGNITANNIYSNNHISTATLTASGNIAGGNISTSGTIDVVGNASVGNLSSAGVITAVGNITGGNIDTAGLTQTGTLISTGNATVGNLGTSGQVTALGNITGGNLISNAGVYSQTLDVAGNIIGNNISANFALESSTLNVTGNADVGNLSTSGIVVAVGNITGNNITANFALQSSTLDVSGNAVVGNLSTAGQVNAAGNITGGNVVSNAGVYSQTVAATGNIVGNNINSNNEITTQTLVASGNITGGNIAISGLTQTNTLNVTTDANVGNLGSAGIIVATGNITGGNISTVGLGEFGNVVVTGNTSSGNFYTTGAVNAGTLTVTGNTIVGGDLAVNGNITYINVETLAVEDPIIQLGRGPNDSPLIANDGKDRGTQMWYYAGNTEYSAFVGYDNSTGNIIIATDVTVANEIVTVNNYGTTTLGNLSALNASVAGNLDAGNINTGKITASSLEITGNITGNNIHSNNAVTTTTLLATGNIQGANINSNAAVTGVTITASGNLNGNNAVITNDISAATGSFGNVSAGNVITDSIVAPSGNLGFNGANLWYLTNIQSSGNITAPFGTITGATVTATGNLNGNNAVITNDISATTGSFSGNVLADNVNSNAAVTGITITASGNLEGNNATITNAITAATVALTGNISANNAVLTNDVSATTASLSGNVLAGNVNSNAAVTGVTVTASGNLVGNNAVITNDVSTSTITASGNILAANVNANGTVAATTVVASGNITANNATISNALQTNTATVIGNLLANNITANFTINATDVSVSANVTAGNVLVGNIGILTSGNIDMGTGWINNLSDPVANSDAATKAYVLSQIDEGLGNLQVANTTIYPTIPSGNITLAPTGNNLVIIDANSGLALPIGTDAERPSTPLPGTIRFNSDHDLLEFWNGTTWDLIESDYAIASQTIVPDGAASSFSLNQDSTAEGLILTINGITQIPNTNYTVAGNVLTMGDTPQSTDIIEVRFIAPVSSTGSIGAGVANSLAYYSAAGSIINDAGPNLTWNGADQLTVAGNVSVTGAFFKVPVYANATARNAAISSPEIGMIVVTAGTFEGYNGATWVTLG